MQAFTWSSRRKSCCGVSLSQSFAVMSMQRIAFLHLEADLICASGAVSSAEHVAVDVAARKGHTAKSAAAAAALLASPRPPLSLPGVPHPQGVHHSPQRLIHLRHSTVTALTLGARLGSTCAESATSTFTRVCTACL